VVLGLVALVIEYGFRITAFPNIYLHLCQVASAVLLLSVKIYFWMVLHREGLRWSRFALDIVLLALVLWAVLWLPGFLQNIAAGAVVRWAVFHVYLLVVVLLYVGRLSVAAMASARAPTRVLLLSFVCVILMGTFLLMLPLAHRAGRLDFTDAVFTATSATCVTGLVVCDTGGDFTRLGQTIILFMMQAGGLGIMIFGAMFALLLGSPLSLRESTGMRDIMNEQAPGRIGRMIVFICLTTLLLELLGTMSLYGLWQRDSLHGGRLFKSVFHAVSAFCNAGFSLQAESLCGYRFNWQIYLVICPLIVLGGLGFPVLNNLWGLAWSRVKKMSSLIKGNNCLVQLPQLSLHSKIALTGTVVLILLGVLLLIVFEWTRPDVAHAEHGGGIILDAVFGSVTARTAGFNTVPTGQLSTASKLALIFLMSIGGSPSSTAGGIKTVTFVVMVLSVYATIRRRQDVHVFHRTIPFMIIRRGATLVILYGLALWIVTLLLSITEHSLGADMLDLLFEAASAMGTVGLSTGVTARLTLGGKWVIIAAMLTGRLGPLGLLAALTFNTKPVRYEYPREAVVIG